MPRLLFYSFFFMGSFGAELVILLFGFFGFGLVPDISLIYLAAMTAIAMSIFLFEGTSLNRRFKTKKSSKYLLILKTAKTGYAYSTIVIRQKPRF